MKTNVVVNVKLVIDMRQHGKLHSAMTETFIEKLARDKVSDIIINTNKNISIESIAAVIKVEKDE